MIRFFFILSVVVFSTVGCAAEFDAAQTELALEQSGSPRGNRPVIKLPNREIPLGGIRPLPVKKIVAAPAEVPAIEEKPSEELPLQEEVLPEETPTEEQQPVEEEIIEPTPALEGYDVLLNANLFCQGSCLGRVRGTFDVVARLHFPFTTGESTESEVTIILDLNGNFSSNPEGIEFTLRDDAFVTRATGNYIGDSTDGTVIFTLPPNTGLDGRLFDIVTSTVELMATDTVCGEALNLSIDGNVATNPTTLSLTY